MVFKLANYTMLEADANEHFKCFYKSSLHITNLQIIPESQFSQTLKAPEEMATLIISHMYKVCKELMIKLLACTRKSHHSVPRQINSIEFYMC